jgi:hypothetical protein
MSTTAKSDPKLTGDDIDRFLDSQRNRLTF